MTIFTPFDLHLFHEGTHQRLYDKFGARPWKQDGTEGVYFAAWMPGARAVSVVGDFNGWNNHANPLEQQAHPAIWEAFVPGAAVGSRYKFHVETGNASADCPDPFAFASASPEVSVVAEIQHDWNEGQWPNHRRDANSLESPIMICAGDAGSAKEMGFSHVLLPTAHAFAPAEDKPRDMMMWIERLHQLGVGAALEVIPPVDPAHGPEHRSVALSAAVFWIEQYHADLLIGRDLIRDDGWREELYRYLAIDPIERRYRHYQITQRMHWAFRENFVLPVLNVPPSIGGDAWGRTATLRLLLAWMYAQPGKKMLAPLGDPLAMLTGQLNHLYRTTSALYSSDHFQDGFEWIEAENAVLNIASFVRKERAGRDMILFVANFSPVPRFNYRMGAPARGVWREVLNTDATEYGGRGHGNFGSVETVPIPLHGQRYSITVTVPPLTGVFFRLERP